MKYEDKIFIIYYNECDTRYINKLISILKERIPFILDFFEINYDKKIVIKLYDNLEEYKENLISSFEKESEITGNPIREYKDWMIANTEDGNINMQSLDLVKKQQDFKNYTEEEFCYNSCHEFAHLCQQQLNSINPGWFWELIATNIGNPECQVESNEEFTLEDLNDKFDEINGYNIVYTLGKYILKNYDKNQIISWIKNNEIFEQEIEQVIDNYKIKKVTK